MGKPAGTLHLLSSPKLGEPHHTDIRWIHRLTAPPLAGGSGPVFPGVGPKCTTGVVPALSPWGSALRRSQGFDKPAAPGGEELAAALGHRAHISHCSGLSPEQVGLRVKYTSFPGSALQVTRRDGMSKDGLNPLLDNTFIHPFTHSVNACSGRPKARP